MSEERLVTVGDDSAAAGPAPAGGPPTDAQRRSTALDELASRPLAEHPDGYEQLHAELRAALAEIDDA